MRKNPNNGNAFGHIPHCAYKTVHTHTHTHTHIFIYICMYIYIWMGLDKATNYETLYYVLYTNYLLPSLSHIQIIFCLRPFTKSDSMTISLKFWSWTIHILRQSVEGLISRQCKVRCLCVPYPCIEEIFPLM